MYSIGYLAYYGLSLIVGSEFLFFVSLAAHACQFGFLLLFEQEHIERLYLTRKPLTSHTLDHDKKVLQVKLFGKRDLIVLFQFDHFRSKDLALFALGAYLSLSILTASSDWVGISSVVGWRIFHSFGLGLALRAQSNDRWLERHFVRDYAYDKEGDATVDCFENFKSTYNLSLCMTYLSFISLAARLYSLPGSDPFSATRQALGVVLVLVHVWSALSSFEALGPAGFFYADFFFDTRSELVTENIYRFLNSPELSLGGAAPFGLALISGSKLLAALALFGLMSHWWFLQAVEHPHVRKKYDKVREHAGVSKTLRQVAAPHARRLSSVTKSARELSGSLDKIIDEAGEAVKAFVSKSQPYLQETKILLERSGERMVISRVANDLASYDRNQYSIKLKGKQTWFQLGEPITIEYSAAEHHSIKDWVGLYRVGASSSDKLTTVSSQGRWLGIAQADWQGDHFIHNNTHRHDVMQGILTFANDKLAWTVGQYEFRYHHDGKHSVMTTSQPFEIQVARPTDQQSATAIRQSLNLILAHCLECPPQSADRPGDDAPPDTPEADTFAVYDHKEAERVSYAIKQAFDVDLSSQVILASPNTAKLVLRILEASALNTCQQR